MQIVDNADINEMNKICLINDLSGANRKNMKFFVAKAIL
jgi:hypothetical protein